MISPSDPILTRMAAVVGSSFRANPPNDQRAARQIAHKSARRARQVAHCPYAGRRRHSAPASCHRDNPAGIFFAMPQKDLW